MVDGSCNPSVARTGVFTCRYTHMHMNVMYSHTPLEWGRLCTIAQAGVWTIIRLTQGTSLCLSNGKHRRNKHLTARRKKLPECWVKTQRASENLLLPTPFSCNFPQTNNLTCALWIRGCHGSKMCDGPLENQPKLKTWADGNLSTDRPDQNKHIGAIRPDPKCS